MTILVLIGTVFEIICLMFHGEFLGASAAGTAFWELARLELMYISHVRSSLTHLHGSQLLVPLS